MCVEHLKENERAAFSVSFKKTTCQVFGREGIIRCIEKGNFQLVEIPLYRDNVKARSLVFMPQKCSRGCCTDQQGHADPPLA